MRCILLAALCLSSCALSGQLGMPKGEDSFTKEQISQALNQLGQGLVAIDARLKKLEPKPKEEKK